MAEYIIGQTYIVNHTRKGKFAMRVTEQDDEWIVGVIVSGTANALIRDNVRGKGEEITVRKSLLTLQGVA